LTHLRDGLADCRSLPCYLFRTRPPLHQPQLLTSSLGICLSEGGYGFGTIERLLTDRTAGKEIARPVLVADGI
jgi:hypothetical protein